MIVASVKHCQDKQGRYSINKINNQVIIELLEQINDDVHETIETEMPKINRDPVLKDY